MVGTDHVLVQDGLLQAGAGSESVSLFSATEYDEKWRIAERKTAELLDGLQPCRPSEDSRRAVINYVEGLIRKHFHCKVFPYGSVPLKTYLPDGDIDLTAISNCHGISKATWAREMCASLEKEEHAHNASGFQVKEVLCIQAKVPVVKCLVGSITVDISFNQLGGLSTVCFLEEVGRLIGRNHLFKRSIILVKAWCFYESRILGAHHGLLSTYALETLVLFVLNAFHRSLRGPLEVLLQFLEFFSKFDWNRYCLGIRGPIPLHSLHKMAGESVQDVSGQFLLSQAFLDACREKYSLCFEGTQGNIFSQKYMNILDPLRPDNNLGGSVNRGNFFRIQKAFAYGAGQLEKLLHSTSHVHLAERLAAFFRNTQKHCRGQRPDSFSGFELCQQVNAFLCDDKASSESANTEVTAENVANQHQFTGVINQTKADILRGHLATYLLNLEAAHCTPMSCLQEPLLYASTTKKCSLPIEQESALEGPERPEAVAPPISATMDAMPISDHLAEGSAKSRRGTGAFIPNLVPGFKPDKRWTNDNRGQHRVKTSKTRRKEKLKARKKEKALLMEGPVHGSFLNCPNGKENIGGLLDTTINITNSSSWPPVEMIQFGSLSPGLLAGSFQDLPSTHGALDSCKANLRARKHALCQQSSQGPYQVNEEDFPPLTFCSQRETPQSNGLGIIPR